jgi:hypothetical protein
VIDEFDDAPRVGVEEAIRDARKTCVPGVSRKAADD